MENIMICNYCGKEIPDGLLFCPECGKKLIPDPEPVRAEKNSDPLHSRLALIVGCVLAAALIASLLIALLPKAQKSPAKLFEDFDLAFDSYCYTVPEDIGDEEDTPAQFSACLTLTNLTEKDIPISMLGYDDETFPRFFVNFPTGEKEEYDYHYLRGFFYDGNGTLLLNDSNLTGDESHVLLAGDSCRVYLFGEVPATFSEKDLKDSYIDVNYNEKWYYWDLENRTDTPEKPAYPYDMHYEGYAYESYRDYLLRHGSDEEYAAQRSDAYLDLYFTVTNRSAKPISLYLDYSAGNSLLPWFRLLLPDARQDEDSGYYGSGTFYDDDNVYFAESYSNPDYVETRERTLQPGESRPFAVRVYFEKALDDPSVLENSSLDARFWDYLIENFPLAGGSMEPLELSYPS